MPVGWGLGEAGPHKRTADFISCCTESTGGRTRQRGARTLSGLWWRRSLWSPHGQTLARLSFPASTSRAKSHLHWLVWPLHGEENGSVLRVSHSQTSLLGHRNVHSPPMNSSLERAPLPFEQDFFLGVCQRFLFFSLCYWCGFIISLWPLTYG